ncbi:MAG: trypsin-like peptidase domain-containing protein [Bacteroidota bacterium]
MKNFALVFTSSLLSAILAIFIYRMFETPREVIVRESSPVKYVRYNADMSSDAVLPTPPDFVTASEFVTATVVNIRSESGGTFDFWSSSSYGASTGSGVIISPDGYIVTNNHVIENGDKIEITLNDRREYVAKKIGSDPTTDLALLKIEESKLPYIQFGNSDSLRVGEWVLAVGNPFDLESTVTAGIVSAKGRNIEILKNDFSIEAFIQTDAMVNPGNSGGALVNAQGNLIGINTAIMTRSGHYEGYSFAIPSNLTRKVIEDLQDFGEVQRGVLGVSIVDIDNKMAKRLGLPTVEGVYIKELTSKEGGAAAAGIRKGDVIISVNDVATKTVPELQEQVGRFRPGDGIKIEYIRKGKRRSTEVLLKNQNLIPSIASRDAKAAPSTLRTLGLELRELLPKEKEQLDVEEGLKVISIYKGSKIESTNMDIGFVILEVNGKLIKEVEDVMLAIEESDKEVELKGIYEDYAGEYVYTFEID